MALTKVSSADSPPDTLSLKRKSKTLLDSLPGCDIARQRLPSSDTHIPRKTALGMECWFSSLRFGGQALRVKCSAGPPVKVW